MTTFRALVVEDEPLARRMVADLLRRDPEIEQVVECADAADAARALAHERVDIAFLDIEMPLMNGLEAAKALDGDAHVVFVTAYDRYAVEAFERGAVDYVLKPASAGRLAETVRRLQARVTTAPASIESLLDELARRVAPASDRLQWLQASLGNTIKLINVDDVQYFQSDTKYTRLVTAEGEALVKKTLRELTCELDPRHFWQVHRGTIVNIRAIATVTLDDAGRREIALRGRPERLEVSRTFAHLFKPS